MSDAVAIGPLVLAGDRLAAIVGLALFLIVAEVWGARRGRRGAATRWATLIVVIGLLAARTGFVIGNWDAYASAPLDILAVWQGGFDARIGGYAAAAVLLAAALGETGIARPLIVAASIGAVAWQGIEAVTSFGSRVGLPKTIFATLDGEAIRLDQRRGRPLVLNLWASWCPPCRREMPMMMETAEERPGIDMVFANQGQDPEPVRAFLRLEELPGHDVVLDEDNSLMRRFDAIGLPATYFFDANGRITGVHVGEISRAALAEQIEELGTKGSRVEAFPLRPASGDEP